MQSRKEQAGRTELVRQAPEPASCCCPIHFLACHLPSLRSISVPGKVVHIQFSLSSLFRPALAYLKLGDIFTFLYHVSSTRQSAFSAVL